MTLTMYFHISLSADTFPGPNLFISTTAFRLKEGVHPKMKTSEKLQFCLHNQPIVLFFLKTVPNPSGSISGPELTHPEASTSPSESQYCTIRCPVLHHPVPVLHFPEPEEF